MTEVERSNARFKAAVGAIQRRSEWCHEKCRGIILDQVQEFEKRAYKAFLALLTKEIQEFEFLHDQRLVTEILETALSDADAAIQQAEFYLNVDVDVGCL